MLFAAFFAITSCDSTSGNGLFGGYVDKWANLVNETPQESSLDEDTFTYGTHTYTVSGFIDFNSTDYTDPTASVTFSNIPSGFTEFKAVYDQLLGKSAHGAAAMLPMAMEIYARKKSTGQSCLEYLCKDADAAKAIMRELDRKFPDEKYTEDNSYSYVQRYLPAALLQGAKYNNAYAPEEPYNIQMSSTLNNKPQVSSYPPYGTTYYMYIHAPGWDTQTRGVDLFLPEGKLYFKVVNCPGCYAQCKPILEGPWMGLK